MIAAGILLALFASASDPNSPELIDPFSTRAATAATAPTSAAPELRDPFEASPRSTFPQPQKAESSRDDLLDPFSPPLKSRSARPLVFPGLRDPFATK